MTNKELQELLKQYPDDADIIGGYPMNNNSNFGGIIEVYSSDYGQTIIIEVD